MLLRKTIAKNVRALRLEKDWTLEQLAKKSRLAIQYISRLEKSEGVNVTADNIEKLAKGLGVTPSELVSPTRAPAADKDALVQLDQAINLLHSFQSQLDGAKRR